MAPRSGLMLRAALAVLAALPVAAVSAAPAGTPSPAQTALVALRQEADAAAALEALKTAAPGGGLAFTNVRIVDPVDETVSAPMTVYVRGPRITWIGETARAQDLASRTVIDGKGRFLAPGLADMHIHSEAAGGWLLNLANGVTTVRDMDGFPWMLAARDAINAGRMLGPTDYVAGPIINAYPMEGYAVVPANATAARGLVRRQAACGYDFIKVHNNLAEPMLDAVAAQAALEGMDLIGHIPHDVSIDHAVHVNGMRTLEHLKGFLLDRTLEPSGEDYAAGLAGAASRTWITPTLYASLDGDRGRRARAVLAAPEARYAPVRTRARWAGLLAAPEPDGLALNRRFVETQKVVMGRLVPLRPRWLAGTDASGYAFNLMGFALIEELRLLQAHGLTPAEALRAATSGPAAALREADAFGRVRVGMRADLVLLDANPLKDPGAYGRNQGVMAHGLWLDRAGLDAALARLAASYAVEESEARVDAAAVAAVLSRLETAVAAGFVFDAAVLRRAAADLKGFGAPADLAAITGLAVRPVDGPCAFDMPG